MAGLPRENREREREREREKMIKFSGFHRCVCYS